MGEDSARDQLLRAMRNEVGLAGKNGLPFEFCSGTYGVNGTSKLVRESPRTLHRWTARPAIVECPRCGLELCRDEAEEEMDVRSDSIAAGRRWRKR